MHNNHNSTTKTEFNFDMWAQLAKEDPEEFERKRRATINTVLSKAPASMQNRLRGLQWRIDMEIKRSKNPLDGCIRINRMMIDTIYAPGGLLESLHRLTDNRSLSTEKIFSSAEKIVPFR